MTDLQSESITEVVGAMIKAHAEFDPVLKDATNPAFRSRYSTLISVLNATEKALAKHELLVMQQPQAIDGKIVLHTRILHKSGEWLGGTYPVNPLQSTPQGEGSALTYARRYALLSILGIAPEDDDAAAGSARPQASNGRARAQATASPDAATDAAKPATIGELRGRINAIGKTKKLSPSDISDDFASWSQGTPIAQATAESLMQYIDYLNKGVAAA